MSGSQVPSSNSERSFATTQWSVVLRAGQADASATDALVTLCERYWSPVYIFLRRRCRDEHAALDITQGFFADLLEHNAVARASPDRGRFRSFLLTAVKHYLINQIHHDQAQKRGGGKRVLSLDWESGESRWKQLEPAHTATAERLFEREWALQVLSGVLQQLRKEYHDDDRAELFEVLRQTLAGRSDQPSYAQLGQQLGLTTDATRQAAHRLRKRYRELLRQHVAATLAAGEDVESEIGHLIAILSES